MLSYSALFISFHIIMHSMHIAANLHLSSALLFYLAIKEDACVELEGRCVALKLASLAPCMFYSPVLGSQDVKVCVCVRVRGGGVNLIPILTQSMATLSKELYL